MTDRTQENDAFEFTDTTTDTETGDGINNHFWVFSSATSSIEHTDDEPGLPGVTIYSDTNFNDNEETSTVFGDDFTV